MFENFPYTDMHQLNLDWIVKIAKDFLEQYTHIQQLIEDGETNLTNLTETGLQQLQDQAAQLEALLQEWYDTHSADIANQLASALAEMSQTMTTLLNNNISAFDDHANIKTADCIASIPSDYTSLFNQVQNIETSIKNIIIEDAAVPLSSTATATTVQFDMSRRTFIEIKNTDSVAGYFSPSMFVNTTDKQDLPTVLINPGETHTFEFFQINNNVVWDWLNGDDYTGYNFYVGFRNINSKTATFTVYNYSDEEPMVNNTVIVAPTLAPGVFDNIIAAIAYIKSKIDVLTVPATILVKNGTYTLYNVNARPAVINKGSNKISIIGESKEGVVFKLSNATNNNNQVMNIGGPCIIKNLSLYNLNGTGVAPILTNNPYCIHNDSEYTTTAKYATIIEDCVCYSEMFNPIGAGLRNRQKQVYRNVTTVYANNFITSGNGSLYIHSQGIPTDVPAGVEITGCTLVAHNTRECVNFPNVHPGDYATIPIRMLNNTGWTAGPAAHYISPSNFNFSPDSDVNGYVANTSYFYNLP